MFTVRSRSKPLSTIRNLVVTAVFMAGFQWAPSPLSGSTELTAPPAVVASFFDGVARREISRVDYRDYLLYHGFDVEEDNPQQKPCGRSLIREWPSNCELRRIGFSLQTKGDRSWPRWRLTRKRWSSALSC